MALKKTHEQFIREMEKINSNIEILGEYINAKTKIKCRCKIDFHVWYVTPDHLHSGGGCPLCAKRKLDASHKRKTHKQYIEDCKLRNPNIEILDYYTTVTEKITCKCKICNGIFSKKGF